MSKQSVYPSSVYKHPRKVWFFRGDLVTIHHHTKSAGIVTIKNYTKDRLETLPMKEFRRYRKKAYTITEAGRLLNRHPVYLAAKAKAGWWPEPYGRAPNGEHIGTSPAYYSEEHLYEIRNIMALIHRGRPRRDKLITNSHTPTEEELRAAINNQLFTYVENEDGERVPVFDGFDNR